MLCYPRSLAIRQTSCLIALSPWRGSAHPKSPGRATFGSRHHSPPDSLDELCVQSSSDINLATAYSEEFSGYPLAWISDFLPLCIGTFLGVAAPPTCEDCPETELSHSPKERMIFNWRTPQRWAEPRISTQVDTGNACRLMRDQSSQSKSRVVSYRGLFSEVRARLVTFPTLNFGTSLLGCEDSKRRRSSVSESFDGFCSC